MVAGADSTGIWASGSNVVIRDNDISAVNRAGDDVDAIRFFGDHITIAHNWAHDVWANPEADGRPHVDCMQTFAHSEPASSHIRIEANKCDSADLRQCLMAEGPHDFDVTDNPSDGVRRIRRMRERAGVRPGRVGGSRPHRGPGRRGAGRSGASWRTGRRLRRRGVGGQLHRLASDAATHSQDSFRLRVAGHHPLTAHLSPRDLWGVRSMTMRVWHGCGEWMGENG
jgi:hypothetical protein